MQRTRDANTDKAGARSQGWLAWMGTGHARSSTEQQAPSGILVLPDLT